MTTKSINEMSLTELRELEEKELPRLGLRWPTVETWAGGMVQLPHKPNSDLIIVCVNWGSGTVPVKMLLPHQLYVHTILQILEDHPRAREIEVFAVHHRDRLPVAALDKHRANEPIPNWGQQQPNGKTDPAICQRQVAIKSAIDELIAAAKEVEEVSPTRTHRPAGIRRLRAAREALEGLGPGRSHSESTGG